MLFSGKAYRYNYYYHGDHLGSSNYVTDKKGRVFEHTLYLPYGETWVDEGSDTSLLGYKFTGKELDEETGLYYFGARYYDPKISGWMSTDPALPEYLPTGAQLFYPEQAFNANSLKGAGGVFNSLNLNIYHYAGLNPVKLIDSDGKAPNSSPRLFQYDPSLNQKNNSMAANGCLFRAYQAVAETQTGKNLNSSQINSSRQELGEQKTSYDPTLPVLNGNMNVNEGQAVINDAFKKLGFDLKGVVTEGLSNSADFTILVGKVKDKNGDLQNHFMLGDKNGNLLWDPGSTNPTDVHVYFSVELDK